jgi:hypothetical protein
LNSWLLVEDPAVERWAQHDILDLTDLLSAHPVTFVKYR